MCGIYGVTKTSLIDYPGKIAAVLFMGGCNFRCPYCYNVDLLNPSSLQPISMQWLEKFLSSRKKWLDGIVISGGEPTCHPNLPALLEWVKSFGYLVKLDTNGSNPCMLQEVVNKGLVDYVAVDVKAPLTSERYSVFSLANGAENVKKSIEILLSSSIDYEFRTTVVPSILTREDIIQIATEIRGARRYYLQQFRPGPRLVDPSLSSLKPYPFTYLKSIRDEISHFFGVCEVRG